MFTPIGALIVAIIVVGVVLAVRGGQFIGRSQTNKNVKEFKFIAGPNNDKPE